jgi:hypothetical protein
MSMEGYNCPNCGAPIGYQDQCEYCGTRIEWRPCVIHLAPKLHYHKVYDASVIGMVKKGALGTENPIAMELAHRELFERLANQMRQNVRVAEEDHGDAVFLRASISYADKNEREEK